ncbi:MAG: hypothetical protein ACLUUO_19435 [Sellimonas intestinalis]
MKKNRALKGNKIVQVILKPHAVYGILIFMTSLVHGVFAGKKAGIMSGKLAWCCLLLLWYWQVTRNEETPEGSIS